MTDNKNKDSKTLEEEIKMWQEVYPIEEGVVVDLSTETQISYKGNTVLLNDDLRKERNTRKAKPSNYDPSELDITDVQTMPKEDMREVKEKPNNSVQDRIKLLKQQGQEDIKLKIKPK